MSVARMIGDLRKKLTGATSALNEELARVRVTIAEKERQLQDARRAPLSPAEIISISIPHVVAEHGHIWMRRYGSGLVWGDRGLGDPNRQGSIYLPWTANEPIPWGALCAAKPELAGEILATLVHAVDYRPGPPQGERSEIIARLEEELRDLAQADEQLVDEAASNGIMIDHRADVVQRREQEAAKRKAEEQAAARRAEREVEINRLHEERRRAAGRAVRSPYVNGGKNE